MSRITNRLAILIPAALIIAATFTAASASATTIGTASDGACFYSGSSLMLKAGGAQFSPQRTTLVKRWVRLVDVNGNPQTGWYYVTYAWGSSTYAASFAPATITRSSNGTTSRIQSYYAFYQNGVFVNDLIVTTTWYAKYVAGIGGGWSSSASGSSCTF